MKRDESAPGDAGKAVGKDPYDGWLDDDSFQELLPPRPPSPPPSSSAPPAPSSAAAPAPAPAPSPADAEPSDPGPDGGDAVAIAVALEAGRAGLEPGGERAPAPAERPLPDELTAQLDELGLPMVMEDSPLGRLRSVLGHARAGWRRLRCGQAAAAFALHAALVLCGLLAAAAAILRGAGLLGAGGALVRAAAWRLLPATPGPLAEQLAAAAARPSAWLLGGAGALLAAAAGLCLFLQAEALWSEAFGAERERPLWQRLLLFNAALTMLPLPLALWLWQSAAQLAAPFEPPPILATLLCSAAVLTAVTRVLPTAPVRWRGALLAGVVGALLLEGGKLALVLAARGLLARPGAYGALAAAPLALLFLMWGWLAALCGLQLAQAALRYRQIDLAALSREIEEQEERDVLVSEVLVLRLLRDLAVHFAGGGKALPAAVLRQRHGLPQRVLARIMRRLEERDLILSVNGAYLPARPLDRVPLDEALQAFTERVTDGGALDRLLGEAEAERRRQLARRTLADLV